MTRPGELFEVRRRFFRSVHLASDAHRPEASEGYAPTPLGRATLGRILDGLGEGRAERAWTLTGPYGVGKSAFVVLLAQLLGAGSNAALSTAMRSLDGVDRELGARVEAFRSGARGLLPVLVSGTYGPLVPALLDAVERAVTENTRESAKRKQLLDDLRALRTSRAKTAEIHRRVAQLFADLADLSGTRHGGVMLVIDELGKCLEHAAHADGGRADEVFLLQELAEAASRSGSRPLLVVTLLHQAFDRYARDLAAETRAEWSKVQGRFEGVAFVDAPGELLRLAARTLQRREGVSARRFAPYDAIADEAVALGLSPPDERATLRQLAPLHPTVALLLPALCRGPLSQNERSLFGFLTSTADGAFGAFLASPSPDAAPVYRLDHLYDFLAATLGPAQYALAGGRRWAAMDDALARLSPAEPALSARVVKAVGVLGLLGSRAVRASKAILCFALASHDHPRDEVAAAIDRLVAASHVVYRRHSDAFALWEGSDVDLDAHFDEARRKRPDLAELAALLRARMMLRPWVARRHFFETGTLRYFDVMFASDDMAFDPKGEEADGHIVYLLPPEEGVAHAELVRSVTMPGGSARDARADLLFGVPREGAELLGAARDWCAWDSVRGVDALGPDPVARRELSARLHLAADRLDAALQSCFGFGDGADVDWVHEGVVAPWRGARALTAALSAACDRTFPEAPIIRNELLNRRVLSSAAAAARRSLLDAMVARPDQPRLGIEGTPPELSMYASVLEAGGLHRERNGVWGFGPPPAKDPLRLGPTWRRIEAYLDRAEAAPLPLRALFAELAAPPVGLREAPVPVLFFAVVLSHPGEVALFEDGNLVLEVSSAVVERLLRRVNQFTVASYRLDGGRLAVLRALWAALGMEGTEGGPIDLTHEIHRRLRRLPRYSRGTRSVGPVTLAARDAILGVAEPARLLFRDLPQALGLAPIERGTDGAEAIGAEYAARLAEALRELAGAHPALLRSIERRIADRLGMTTEGEVFRAELSARSRRIADLVSDLKLKAFVGRALDAQAGHNEWLEGLAMVVGNRPPAEWTDGEITRFESGLEEVRALFLRAEGLDLARAGARHAHDAGPEQRGAIEGAEREILQLLEGRFAGQREVWLAALSRTLHSVMGPTNGAERATTDGSTDGGTR